MGHRAAAVIGVVGIVTAAAAAAPSGDADWAGCQAWSIEACTAIIQSGRETPRYLANAFTIRGNIHLRNQDFDRAIQDYDQVIRLAPDQAAGFGNRAFAYLKLQKADLAIADYDAALRANPKNPFALYGRGMARRLHGDTAGADADIAAAQQIKADIAEHFRGR